jgi:hypothetical protein
MVVGLVFLVSAVGQQFDEYQVKAAFVINFATFVEWPQTVFRGPADPFSICVLGRNPFGHSLEILAEGKVVEGRRLAVREFEDVHQATGCQILFVSSSERLRFRSILERLKTSSMLSVGDAPDFIAEGGMVNLRLDGGKVRVEINLEAAKEKNIRISSHLLSLARISR